MKPLSRFIQPRSPYFWLMVMFNALTGLLAWVTQTMPLPGFLKVLIAVLAIGNGLLGYWALKLMLRTAPSITPSATPSAAHSDTQSASQAEQPK